MKALLMILSVALCSNTLLAAEVSGLSCIGEAHRVLVSKDKAVGVIRGGLYKDRQCEIDVTSNGFLTMTIDGLVFNTIYYGNVKDGNIWCMTTRQGFEFSNSSLSATGFEATNKSVTLLTKLIIGGDEKTLATTCDLK